MSAQWMNSVGTCFKVVFWRTVAYSSACTCDKECIPTRRTTVLCDTWRLPGISFCNSIFYNAKTLSACPQMSCKMKRIRLYASYIKSETCVGNLADEVYIRYFTVLRHTTLLRTIVYFVTKLDVSCRVTFNNFPQMPPVSRDSVGLRSNHSYCLMLEAGSWEVTMGMYESEKEEVRKNGQSYVRHVP
jgi:hypothetical protein